MPRTRSSTLLGHVVRSVASVSGMFLLLAIVLVLGPHRAGQDPADGRVADVSGPRLWERAYSERYPGCVSMVLWPLDEVPVALVTRTPAGSVERVPLDEVDRAPLSPVGRAHAIGACR